MDSNHNQIIQWLKTTKNNDFKKNLDIFNAYTRSSFDAPMSSNSFMGNNSIIAERYTTKWDTTADSISSQAASNFTQALLPLGEKSIKIYFEKLREYIKVTQSISEININKILAGIERREDIMSSHLQNMLDTNVSNFMEMLNNNIRDYLDYGNCAILLETRYDVFDQKIFFKNLDFNNVYFWEDQKSDMIALLLNEEVMEFQISIDHPKYLKDKSASNIFNNKKVKKETLFLSSHFFNYIDLPSLYEEFSVSPHVKPSFIELIIVNNNIIDFRIHATQNIFIGTINKNIDGYGRGDGLAALGSIVMANFGVGSQFLTVQKTNRPPVVMLDHLKLTNSDMSGASYSSLSRIGGEGLVDYGPGAVTILSASSLMGAVTPSISGLIQPLTPQYQSLNSFIELTAASRQSIADTYKATTMSMKADIPNETAMAASARIQQTIRDYRSRSDGYCNRLLFPMLFGIMISTQGNFIAEMENWINEKLNELSPEGGDHIIPSNVIIPEIRVASFIDDAEKQLQAINLRQELETRGLFAQVKEAFDEDLGRRLSDKMDDLYNK